jgi:hypothetical protein
VLEAQLNPQTAPFNDVNLYGYWVDQVNSGQGIFGVSEPWVYPFLAFAPMAVAKWLGAGFGVLIGWIVLVGFYTLSPSAPLSIGGGRENRRLERSGFIWFIWRF